MIVCSGTLARRLCVPAGKQTGLALPHCFVVCGSARAIRGEANARPQQISVKEEDRGAPRFMQ